MNKSLILVSVLLIAQATALYSGRRTEVIPLSPPLAQFPTTIDEWSMVQEGVVDAETQAVLRADDTLTRVYGRGRQGASLFIAAFKSQRAGKAPHSPKNCLPGSGWVQTVSDHVMVDVPNHSPIEVNRYVVARGEAKSLVLYWYQSRDRSIASEYTAKLYVIADAIRLNRTDTALVRVIIPLGPETDPNAATKVAKDFVQSIYPKLRAFLPA
ncbi:MAG: exosortase C-terminal domain/associated protein EpsI [Bryobacteraceae bacterium]